MYFDVPEVGVHGVNGIERRFITKSLHLGIVDLNLNIILSFGLKLQNAVVTQLLTRNV